MCNIEFPHFGASYPDAHCIDGYLWDMDSYENGCYTIGGDDPCPFCNTEAWLKTVLDNEEFASREEALAWVEKMREKWGAEHLASPGKTSSGSSEIPNDLEEYASGAGFDYVDNIVQEHPDHRFNDHDVEFAYRDGFIAGAKWQKEQDEKEQADLFTIVALDAAQRAKEQMLKEVVEGKIAERVQGKLYARCQVPKTMGIEFGDKVRVIILKKED